MLLDDGHVTTFLQTRPITVGGRTGPVHRQDYTWIRERPADPFTSSLLPGRRVE